MPLNATARGSALLGETQIRLRLCRAEHLLVQPVIVKDAENLSVSHHPPEQDAGLSQDDQRVEFRSIVIDVGHALDELFHGSAVSATSVSRR